MLEAMFVSRLVMHSDSKGVLVPQVAEGRKEEMRLSVWFLALSGRWDGGDLCGCWGRPWGAQRHGGRTMVYVGVGVGVGVRVELTQRLTHFGGRRPPPACGSFE